MKASSNIFLVVLLKDLVRPTICKWCRRDSGDIPQYM